VLFREETPDNSPDEPDAFSVERYRNFANACRYSSQEVPEALSEDSSIAEQVEVLWSNLARNFDQSFWQPEFGEAALKSVYRLSERLEQGRVSQQELAFFERFTDPIEGVHEGNRTRSALSVLALMVHCPQEERNDLFDVLDSLISERDQYTIGFAGIVANSCYLAFTIQDTVQGSFHLIKEVARVYETVGAHEVTPETVAFLDKLTRVPINDFMVAGFKRAVVAEPDIESVRKAFGHVVAYALGRQAVLHPDFETNLLFREAAGIPLGLWDRGQATSTGKQIKSNFLRLGDGFEGFQADRIMAMRPPEHGARSLYDRFGSDIGRVRILNQDNKDGFPGPGLLLKIISLERALKPHYRKSANDPLHVYREIWPGTEQVLHHLPESQFMIARAQIAVIGPKGQMYQLQPVPDKPAIPYSLIIFNANHGNEKNHIATLVPTAVLEKKIANRAVQITPTVDLPEPLHDINDAALRFEDLQKAAHAMGYPLIAVGSPAALSGHYEYTIDLDFAPQPMPLDSIETDVRHQRRIRNAVDVPVFGDASPIDSIYGHKGPMVGPDPLLHAMTRHELHTSMLHRDVSMVTNRLLELWQAVKYIRSIWSKGHTTGKPVDVDFTHDQLHEALEAEGLPKYWNANCVRMLVEAYRWNKASKEDPTKPAEQFPVLVAASAQWHGSAPNINDILLDTFENPEEGGMTFRDIDGHLHTLNSPDKGKSLEDAVFFVKSVLWHVQSDHIELRFYHREVADWTGIPFSAEGD
jgi:hypothetical protein